MDKRNKAVYWAATILLALGMLSGGLAQLFRVKQNTDGIIHLGYPVYLMSILGVLKLLGVIAILLPGFRLLKEWAYAGFFFAMTGAVASHIAVGDGFPKFAAPLLFVILTIVSWYFRPADRKIAFIKN
ncbi:DoxX family protein [Ravibacter arvi]|uniref:DoxX family protein n=1 Tax=Ravibacter arvi TaxID=2051041 RepID=A0ABP8LU68_9BACT